MKVRQAIAYAVPYKTILSQVLQGYGRQLTSPIPFGTPTHTDKYFVYETNVEKAKQLLKDAGYRTASTSRSTSRAVSTRGRRLRSGCSRP